LFLHHLAMMNLISALFTTRVTHYFSITGRPGLCYQSLLQRVNSTYKVRLAFTTRKLSLVTFFVYYFSINAFINLLKNIQIYQSKGFLSTTSPTSGISSSLSSPHFPPDSMPVRLLRRFVYRLNKWLPL